MVERMRIKKYQQPKIEQWSQALEMPETSFVEEAINFYCKYLEGQLQPVQEPAPATTKSATKDLETRPAEIKEDTGSDDLDDFTGEIEL